MRRALSLFLVGLGITGCMMETDMRGSPTDDATASLSSSDSGMRGRVRFKDTSGGLRVQVAAERLPAGIHGIHIHGVGRCDAPDFQSAGPHWNPAMKQHGHDNPQGAHDGDLPNLTVGADGRGTLTFTIPQATLSSLLDADGASVVVHANADDYRTDPSGNSGARIACGVITRR